MTSWGFLFTVSIVCAIILICAWMVGKWFLCRLAERISDQIYKRGQEVQRQLLSAGAEEARVQLQRMGFDGQRFQELTASGQALLLGCSDRITRFGERHGLDLVEAKERFFKETRRMAVLMDSAVPLPVLGGIGLDAPLGWFIPVAGDFIGKGVSLAIIFNSLQFGLPKELISQMVSNAITDVLIGWIPFLGDLLDVGYKANKRNVDLLEEYLVKQRLIQSSSPKHAPARVTHEREVPCLPGDVPLESRSDPDEFTSISAGRQRESLFAPRGRATSPLIGGSDGLVAAPPGPPTDARLFSGGAAESSPAVLFPPTSLAGEPALAEPSLTRRAQESRALRCHRFASGPVDRAPNESLGATEESERIWPEVDLASNLTLEQPLNRNEDGHSWDDYLDYFRGLSDPEKLETLANLECEVRNFLIRLCNERGEVVPHKSAKQSRGTGE